MLPNRDLNHALSLSPCPSFGQTVQTLRIQIDGRPSGKLPIVSRWGLVSLWARKLIYQCIGNSLLLSQFTSIEILDIVVEDMPGWAKADDQIRQIIRSLPNPTRLRKILISILFDTQLHVLEALDEILGRDHAFQAIEVVRVLLRWRKEPSTHSITDKMVRLHIRNIVEVIWKFA